MAARVYRERGNAVEPLSATDRAAIAIMNEQDPPRELSDLQATAVANVFDDVYAASADESRTDCPLTLDDAA
jgi:hypothetical protein